MMSQVKFYKSATWALLFLNIAILSFFFLNFPPPPHHSSNKFQSEVIELLDLNSQQESVFLNFANDHHQKIKAIEEQQQKLLPPYFESLADSSKKIDEKSLLNEYKKLEEEKIKVTYLHFQDIRSILNENQAPSFKALIRQFVDRLLLNNKKNSPPH